jgi:GTPase SAR1 family protein
MALESEALKELPFPEQLPESSSLDDLQTDEQRRVLDTVAQVRKCGLDSVLSLPQLVVCGDQSAGKSSVLEALTEIPFPRNDNLCTRFATEIILRRSATDTLTIKVIPDASRPAAERATLERFEEAITDFADLPRIMDLAMAAMGLTSSSDSQPKAFSKDVLSITIDGPSRPQLTLVDIPGLIATSTKGVSDEDVEMVAEITDRYIKNHRTICLAVITATNDYSNQSILKKVRIVDPDGNRTLGIITKPDRLYPGSGSERAFLELARNEDVFFKLGWHVLKNRSPNEQNSSLKQRWTSETGFFSTSNFKDLPKENVGIDSLRARLSLLLFEHVKQELPKLRQDLENALTESQKSLKLMGQARSTPSDCKAYLAQLSLDHYEICRAGVNGHYEGDYFRNMGDSQFSLSSPGTISRLRAVVQFLNSEFSRKISQTGHKYQISKDDDDVDDDDDDRKSISSNSQVKADNSLKSKGSIDIEKYSPRLLDREEGLQWVRRVLVRTRGKELMGNFNPLLIGELFWEQSSNWQHFATSHIDHAAGICEKFLDILLEAKAPQDVKSRVWMTRMAPVLKARRQSACNELEKLIEDVKGFPINYNHYYTDTISMRRWKRQEAVLAECLKKNTSQTAGVPTWDSTGTSINIEGVIGSFSKRNDPDMDNFSCEEALECLFAIYKVSQLSACDILFV